jgi:hypothetical protein
MTNDRRSADHSAGGSILPAAGIPVKLPQRGLTVPSRRGTAVGRQAPGRKPVPKKASPALPKPRREPLVADKALFFNDAENFITVKEAAGLLRKKTGAIYAMMARGQLSRCRVAGTVWVYRPEILTLITVE